MRYYAEAKNTSALNGRNGKSHARKPPVIAFEHVLQLAEQGDLRALEALDLMAHSLGKGIAMLVTGLAPDVIVVVGEVTRAWDRIGTIINDVVKKRSSTHATTKIIASGPALQPRLRGIIALVLQRHFGAPTTA